MVGLHVTHESSDHVMDSKQMDSPDKQTCVYLPGLDGTGRLLFAQPKLHSRCQLVCESYANDKSQTYRSLADQAAETIQRVARRPVILLAESFGGGVAIDLVLRYPERVGRLVLVNTFAKYPTRWLIRAGALLGRTLPDRPSPPRTRKLREHFLFADDLPPDVRTRWWQCVADVSMAALAHRIRMIAGLDRREDLASIQVSTEVIVATDDRTVPPSAGYLLAQSIPAARLIKVTGGHTVLAHPRFDLCECIDPIEGSTR